MNVFGPRYLSYGYGGNFLVGTAAVAYCDGPTLSGAIADLASRLNDPLTVHWTAAELARYLQEALRTWNVWTAYYHGRGDVDLPLGTAFVDLSVELASLRPQTVTNWDLVTELQYALLEPPAAGGSWTGTSQFNLAQLTAAIERRRDQFLGDAGIIQTRIVTAYGSVAASGRIPLPICALQVRRVAWTPDATFLPLPLSRADEWSATAFKQSWTTPVAQPSAYSTAAPPMTSLQILPVPLGGGTLDLIAVSAGGDLTPATATPLGIPDDYLWVLKYGVLADLLSNDGLAIDMARAAYCEARFAQGVELARRNAVCLAASIIRTANSVDSTPTPCQIGSLADADAYAPTWQLLAGIPRTILLAGQNLLGVWPPAGGGATYRAQLDVVRCAPSPLTDADLLQLPRDVYDAILDLAQHAALFKEGPGQVEQALPLLERAAKAAGVELELQQAQQPARRPLHGQQQQDTSTSPRRLPPVPVEAS